jgi:hypothetical protein
VRNRAQRFQISEFPAEPRDSCPDATPRFVPLLEIGGLPDIGMPEGSHPLEAGQAVGMLSLRFPLSPSNLSIHGRRALLDRIPGLLCWAC